MKNLIFFAVFLLYLWKLIIQSFKIRIFGKILIFVLKLVNGDYINNLQQFIVSNDKKQFTGNTGYFQSKGV